MNKRPLANAPEFGDQVFSIDEAAEYLRVSRAFLYKFLKSGRLIGKKLGSRRLITGSAIQSLLED